MRFELEEERLAQGSYAAAAAKAAQSPAESSMSGSRVKDST